MAPNKTIRVAKRNRVLDGKKSSYKGFIAIQYSTFFYKFKHHKGIKVHLNAKQKMLTTIIYGTIVKTKKLN